MTFIYAALPFVIGELRCAFEAGPVQTILSLSLILLGYSVWTLYLKFGGG